MVKSAVEQALVGYAKTPVLKEAVTEEFEASRKQAPVEKAVQPAVFEKKERFEFQKEELGPEFDVLSLRSAERDFNGALSDYNRRAIESIPTTEGVQEYLTRAKFGYKALDGNPELLAELKAKGKIGFGETWNRMNKWGIVPYLGDVTEIVEDVKIFNLIKKSEENPNALTPDERQELQDFALDMIEIDVRGQTLFGKYLEGAYKMPAFAIEFMTGGAILEKLGAKVAGGAVKKGITTGIKKVVQGQIARGVTKVVAEGTARAILNPVQWRKQYVDRKLNDSITVTDKGEIFFKEGDEKPATTLIKSFGDVWIEQASETAGSHLFKPMGKGIMQKLPKGLKAKFSSFVKKETGKGVRAGMNKLGFDGMLEEMGEERLGDFLRVTLDLDPEQGYALDQYGDALFPEWEDLLVEAGVIGTFGAFSRTSVALANRLADKEQVDTSEEFKKILNEVDSLSETQRQTMLEDVVSRETLEDEAAFQERLDVFEAQALEAGVEAKEVAGVKALNDAFITVTASKLGKSRSDIAEEFLPTVTGEKKVDGKTLSAEQRGYYSPAKNLIGLLPKADRSTFLHETAHSFFEFYLDNIPTELDAVFKWIGKELPADIESLSNGDWTEAQEAFAKGFETYLAEGTAPNKTLAKVFEDFRQWLLDIYDRVSNIMATGNFDLELSDDVRQVMSDMINVEAEREVTTPEGQAYERIRQDLYQKGYDKSIVDEIIDKAILDLKEAPIAAKPVTEADGEAQLSNDAKFLNNSYEQAKEIYFGERDIKLFEAQVEARLLRQELETAIGAKKGSKKYQVYDNAMHIYLDMQADPNAVSEYYDSLTEGQQGSVDLAQRLPTNVKAIAGKIKNSYDAIGVDALNAEVIANVIDNYVGRVWDLGEKSSSDVFKSLSPRTRHAKQRVFTTILEGLSKQHTLKIKGAINNLELLKTEITKTIADKSFITALQEAKTIEGEPLATTTHLEGYKELEHYNFTVWRGVGAVEEAKAYGKNFFVAEDGTVFEKKRLYAPKDVADNLNNIFGTSKLKQLPGLPGKLLKAVDKTNAHLKAWILQSSFFHHLAFMRSYYLGTGGKQWQDMSIKKAYHEGLRSIEQSDPIIRLGVKNGLTLGLQQEWQKELLKEKTALSKLLEKWDVTKDISNKIGELREGQADFLFGEFGAGLKAKAFMIEYTQHVKKHPELTADEAAKHVANLMNDDFGGLHLERLGRNPTAQHIFRIFTLAPDWTESNIRSMVKAVSAGGEAETALYRKFWGGIAVKSAMYSVLLNMIMAALDEDDKDAHGAIERFIRNYARAWEEGKLKWTGVDITPLYKLMGGETERRKYFSIIGHFKDPLKFITHPLSSAKHKGSVFSGILLDMITGSDWAGRKYTSVEELFKAGKLVEFSYAGGKALSYEQIPSFIIEQLKGAQPVQVQNLISWLGGEMEGFDALFNSMGLGVSTTYERKKKKKRL